MGREDPSHIRSGEGRERLTIAWRIRRHCDPGACHGDARGGRSTSNAGELAGLGRPLAHGDGRGLLVQYPNSFEGIRLRIYDKARDFVGQMLDIRRRRQAILQQLQDLALQLALVTLAADCYHVLANISSIGSNFASLSLWLRR